MKEAVVSTAPRFVLLVVDYPFKEKQNEAI